MDIPKPNWTIEWLGHPSGHPRSVHVFFREGAAPADASAAGMELAQRLEKANSEGLFNNAVLTFAEDHHLRVLQVVHGSDHRYPGGDVITVTFDVDLPPSVSIAE